MSIRLVFDKAAIFVSAYVFVSLCQEIFFSCPQSALQGLALFFIVKSLSS